MRTITTPSDSASSGFSRTLGFGAAGGLVLASAGNVSAAVVTNGGVVYNDNPGVMLTTAGSLDFDIDGGGDDFTISGAMGTKGTYDKKVKMKVGGTSATGSLSTTGAFSFLTSALSNGTTVGSGSTLNNPSTAPLSFGESYYGFSLTNGPTYYGWIKVSFSDVTSMPYVQVVEWAYDQTGAAIDVGATSSAIPEPATNALSMAGAALLAGSAAAWRRRKSRVAAAA